MVDKPTLAGQLLYGRRFARRRPTLQSLQYSEEVSYRELSALLRANVLPLNLRRQFPDAHIVGRAERCSDRFFGEKVVVTLTGIVPDRRLVVTLYRKDDDAVISLDYEAQLNILLPGPGANRFIHALAATISDEALLEVCSTSPKTLERLIDDYPPGWRLGRYRGDGTGSQSDCLARLAETTMLLPDDGRILAAASGFDELTCGSRGRDALLNCNQYVALYLLRPLGDLAGRLIIDR